MASETLKRLTRLEKTVQTIAEITQAFVDRQEVRAKTLQMHSLENPKLPRNIATLEELDKRGTMTMKEIAEHLGVSVQTAWVAAHECIREPARCFLLKEPHGRNYQLRLVSMRLAPELASILSKRVTNN
jgi:hypothetical protein